jgi:hypothetical protein
MSKAVRIEVTHDDGSMDTLEGPGTDDVWRTIWDYEDELPALKLMRHEHPFRKRTELRGTPEQQSMFGCAIPQVFMPWSPEIGGYRTIVVDVRVMPHQPTAKEPTTKGGDRG